MTNKNHTMQNVAAIVFDTSKKTYHVNYRWMKETAVDVNHPVYTTGENISRRERSTRPTVRTAQQSENVPVSQRVAKAMGRAFKNAGRLGSREDLGVAVIQNIKPPSAKRVVAIGDNSGVTDFDFSQPSGVIGDDTAADFSPANY